MHQQTNLQVTYAKEASITYLFERNKNKNTKCSLLLFNRMIICYISIASSFDQKLQTNVPQFILHKEAQQTKQSPKKLNEKKKLNSLNSEINMKSFWHQQMFFQHLQYLCLKSLFLFVDNKLVLSFAASTIAGCPS